MPTFPEPIKGELPTKGTRLYRGSSGGEVGGAGIHWTLDKDVASVYAQRGDGYVMETEVDDPEGQVIPRQSLTFRSKFDEETMSNPALLAREQEYHLRPGASMRLLNREQLGEHFPEQIRIAPTGEGVAYKNLASFATTPLAGAKVTQNYADRFGETQGALFDEVTDKSGKPVKYIPAFDLDAESNLKEWEETYQPGYSSRSMEVFTPPKGSS